MPRRKPPVDDAPRERVIVCSPDEWTFPDGCGHSITHLDEAARRCCSYCLMTLS